jgi:hypothetical protein
MKINFFSRICNTVPSGAYLLVWRLETGRYKTLPVHDHKYPFCDFVEDECLVLRNCILYDRLNKKAAFNKQNFLNRQTDILFQSKRLISP